MRNVIKGFEFASMGKPRPIVQSINKMYRQMHGLRTPRRPPTLPRIPKNLISVPRPKLPKKER